MNPNKVTYVILAIFFVFFMAVMNDEFCEEEPKVSYHQAKDK